MTDTRLNLMPGGQLDPVRIARALRDELKGKFLSWIRPSYAHGGPPHGWAYSDGGNWAEDTGGKRLNRAISERFKFWHKQGELTRAEVAKLERAKASIKAALARRTGMGRGGND